jgi:hypothetical protein
MSVKKSDYDASHEISFAALLGRLVILSTCSGLRTDQPGLFGATTELADATQAARDAAGIPQGVYDHFLLSNQTVTTIDQYIETVARMAEVLRQSRAWHVDARNNDISLMVDAMRSLALRRRDDSAMVQFQKTLAYHSQIGEKAAQTRKKNAEAAAEDTEAEAEEAGDTTAPAPAPAPVPAKPDAA